MKSPFTKLLFSCLLIAFGLMQAQSQTLNWGSALFSNIVDSKGNALDSTYVFEIGSFDRGSDPSFAPDASNMGEWYSRWRVFDQASSQGGTFDPQLGYVTATADMNPNGTSASPYANSGTFSFSGLEAYLWVKNATGPFPTTEWALLRASSWTFPTADGNCCPGGLPTEWSLSDLSSETPIYGSQDGINGLGAHIVSGNFALQTFTFVPEPSTTLLLGITAMLLGRRRRS